MSTICYESCKPPRLSVTGRRIIVLIVATLLVQLGAHLSPTEYINGPETAHSLSRK